MKTHSRMLITAGAAVTWLFLAGATAVAADAPEPTWETLSRHAVPEWFVDAKFGIYAHWGVYSVPAFDNEWYPRNMYQKDSRVQKHHIETYGPLSKFGYKDFVPMFTAEKFNADEWADLYVRAGATFAGPVAEHHDGFSMWASKVNRWNAAQMGPKRDVAGELVKALRKRGLRVITSFHHGYNFTGYYQAVEGADTADPQYEDLYGQYKDKAVPQDRWLAKLREVIDAYQPDQIWFDFCLGHLPDEYRRQMAAYYYGKEAEWQKGVIITRKGTDLPDGVGVLDIERGKMDKPAPFLWQTDDSVAVNSWCWVQDLQLKPAEELIHELIDIVSKNGVLLLNVCPKADGTFPDDQKSLLYEMGDWLKMNGAAIYATRPWFIHGEGPNLFDPGRGFTGPQVRFTSQDIRYTRSKDGKTLYAIVLGWPEQVVVLRSVQVDAAAEAKVTLLGRPGAVQYELNDLKQPVIHAPALAPEARPCRYAWTFELTGFTVSLHPEARFSLPGAVTLGAEQAVLEGEQIKLEKRTDQSNIGFWDKPGDKVHWLVRIAAPGEYLVRGQFAAAAGASRVALDADGKSVTAEVPATSGWDKAAMADLGRLSFDKPGVFHIVLRPADAAQWKPVNLWKLQLAPAQ